MSKTPPEPKSHKINELEQEKMILEEINQFLEQKEYDNQKILDSMSHELRTPIVIIKSYVDMLLQKEFGDITSIQHEKLVHIQNNVELLTKSIFKILKDLERLDNDK